MKTYPCSVLALLLVTAVVRATEPPPAPAHGGTLVLLSDRVIEGDIEKVGDQYRVRRASGETWLPSAQVRCLCADLDAAYRFLRGQANLDDASERLRLARFCLSHHLLAQAIEEATAAAALRPDNVEARRLLASLQRTAASPPTVPPPVEEAVVGPTADAATLDGVAFGQFVQRVQPLLMNACASCHANGRGGSFKLARTFSDAGLTNRRATQQNLTAVLGAINRDRPTESTLLTHSVALHGRADKAPLKGRTEPAYRSLEEWVQLAVSSSAPPTPREAAPSSVPAVAVEKPLPVPPAPVESQAVPAAKPAGIDPYDPAVFNRKAHPGGGSR